MDASLRDGRTYEFGPFVIDPTHRVLTHEGVEIALSPTLFEVLLYLVEHAGRVVSKEELLDAIWPRKTVAEANVSQTIFTLRKALAEAGASEPLIETAARRGYRFTCVVRVQDRRTGSSADSARAGVSPVWPLGGRRHGEAAAMIRVSPRTSVLAGAILLAIAGGAAALWLRDAGKAPPPANVVALAYFENSTGEPIFDRTLDTALRIDLEQSPFVTLISQRQVADTLAFMKQPGDARLTPTLAAEVCIRNNGHAAIEGGIARLDGQYLLTATATDCADDRVLAAEKTQVAGREAVIPALDRLVGRIRTRLGEPEVSVANFSVPLMNEKTASLAAIKTYSEALFLARHGQYPEAIPLYRHAVELDPNFAVAYYNMAVAYNNIYQREASVSAIKEAYKLRDLLNGPQKILLDTLYNTYVTGNYVEATRAERTSTEIYPNRANGWSNLSNSENWLGRYAAAINAGQHAVTLAPDQATNYVVLARALMHAGRLDDASAILARSAAKGLGGGQLPGLMMEISIARNDSAAVERAIEAANGQPYETDVLQLAAADAYRQGQVRRGDEIYARAAAIFASQGMTDYTIASHAIDLARLGLADRARRLLARLPANSDPTQSADASLAFATIGDDARVRTILDSALHERPSDTVLSAVFAPEARAVLALRQGQPLVAVEDLRPAAPYETRDYDIPYLRGRAYLAAKDGADAAGEFEKILDHPGVLPADEQRALAQLGLARAYALQRDMPASRKAYEQFFAEWKGADPDLPPLRAAKAEYAGL